jgi:hypothetical protein
LSEDILGTDANQTIVAMSVKRMLVSVTLFFFLFYLAFSPIVPLSMVSPAVSGNESKKAFVMLCVKTAMLAHSRGNLISISWAKNLSFLYRNWLSEDILGTDANQTIVAMSVKRMLVSVTLFFFLFYLAFSPIV